MLDLNATEERILSFIRESVRAANARGLILGISGGIDSAVSAALAVKALGRENVLGLLLPCESSSTDLEDALLLVERLGIRHKIIDLTGTYRAFLKDSDVEAEANLSYANIKPRLRMTALYFHGALEGYLVLGTSNKSELVTGYLTKYGDGGVDIEPLSDLLKREVYQLAERLGIPEPIIRKAPTAGLISGQTDEEELGFRYEDLDRFIESGEGTPEVAERILKLYRASRHKIDGPRMLDLNRRFYLI